MPADAPRTPSALDDDPSFKMRKRREEMRKKGREEAESIVRLAGFETKHVWELVNGYWPETPEYDSVREPWWLFLTDIGPVQLGWRKNVMHIQWDACAVRGIVTDDEVTKANTYVHAWKTEKAVEYLKKLRALATSSARKEDPHG